MKLLSKAICLSVLLTACSNEQSTPAPVVAPETGSVPVPIEGSVALPAVDTVTLSAQSHNSVITTFGVVEGLEQVDLASEMAGTVARILVKEGDAVDVGDVLLELDSEKQEYRVAQARQEAQQAKAMLDEADARLQRRKDLVAKNTISEEDLDNARLKTLATGAAYQRALAAKRLAERELADTQVRSPSAGLVERRFIEPGEPVAIGTTLVSLQVVHTMRVHAWVSEADIVLVRPNAPANITLSGARLQQFDAVVEWVGVNADRETGNFPVKLLLQDASDWIRPGMTATARIEGFGLEQALILPERALVDRKRRQVVFVVVNEDGRTIARMKEPQLAAGFTNRLVVLAGLEAGDQLIVSDHASLLDGTEVRILQ